LLRAAFRIARVVPLPLLRRALCAVAMLVMRVDAHHRNVVLGNLQIAFPDSSGSERSRLAREAFANWGRIAAELAQVDELLARPRDESFREFERRLEQLQQRGRGVPVLSAHTANFELLARMAGREGREMVLLHRAMTNPLMNRFLCEERKRAHVGTLGRGVSVRAALRVLARGGVIVAPMDQNQSAGRGIFVDMFGRPASTSTFLARLSMLSGGPVLPVFAVWRNDDVVPLLGTVIEPPATVGDRRRVVADLTSLYTQEIERAVRAHPGQWNWAHRRWKTRPEEAAAGAGISAASFEDNVVEARSNR
jgi:KDO2-lipid IV(A) lauroyltransferase